MDKKLNADLVDFFLKIPDTWDKILIKVSPSIFCMGRRVVLIKK